MKIPGNSFYVQLTTSFDNREWLALVFTMCKSVSGAKVAVVNIDNLTNKISQVFLDFEKALKCVGLSEVYCYKNDKTRYPV